MFEDRIQNGRPIFESLIPMSSKCVCLTILKRFELYLLKVGTLVTSCVDLKLLADQNGHIFVEIKSVRAFKIQRNDKEGIQQRPSVYLDEFKLL